jgi:outer membrane lipoprotein LolB
MRVGTWMALFSLTLLAACTGTAPVRMKGDAAMLGAQEAREQALAGRDHWTLQGKLSVSDGKDGGPSSLTWRQQGESYELTMRLPLSGKSVRLSGDANGALLEGLDGGPQRGTDAEALMLRALGWQVPLHELRAWVLGVRASGSKAELDFGADRLPAVLQQDGWRVEYRAWDEKLQPAMPLKIFADRKPYSVRLAINSWAFNP